MSAVGERIGHYQIQSPLGSGGMGEVYRALDTQLNRPVAVKFLSAHIADPSARQRFEQEARMASALNHPHILTVYDAGEVDDRQYLVTELVDGGTLDDWARDGKRTWRQVVELLVGIADGLATAHQAGILHRDIKPANILITKSGYAKLADFGLAKREQPVSPDSVTRTPTKEPTRPGAVFGTVPYMSPEQALGRLVDARSDIFSFGLVLYEQLSGRRAFQGKSDLDTLHAVAHDAARPLPTDLPVGLGMLVEKAIEKDPADRYQSMRELVVDLRREARRRIEPASPGAAVVPVRRRGMWAIIALGGAVVAAAAWLAYSNARPDTTAPELANPLTYARFTRLTDFAGDELDASISPDGKFVSFVSDRDGRFDVWLSQIGSGEFRNLTNGQDTALPAPVRGPGFSQDGSQVWLGGGSGRRLQIAPLMGGAPRPYLSDRIVTLAWSPDGNRLVYNTRDPGDPIFVADRDGANARQILIGANAVVHNHFPVWSLDGRSILFVSGSPPTSELDIWRIAPEGGQPERLTNHNAVVGYPTPIDARTVVYIAAERGAGPWLWALDLERRETRRISLGLEQYTSISASADGRRLVATIANPTSSVWEVPILERIAEERDARQLPLPSVNAATPLYAGPSLYYVSSGASGRALWRSRGGEVTEFWRAGDDPLMASPALSQSGRVAIALRRNGKLRLHVLSADGAELQPLTEVIDVRGSHSWSPDERWLVTGGNDGTGDGLFKIPLEGGDPVRLVKGQALDPVWSPDGRSIVYAGPNVGSQAPLLAVQADGTTMSMPPIQVRRDAGGSRSRFLPDGRSLVYTQGFGLSQDFWILDLQTRQSRQLTRLNHQTATVNFAISPDGRQIVFDRTRNASDIVLIELSGSPRP
jgi:Tol biopolymer transport system component/predicted Ser/Thr protein kinase